MARSPWSKSSCHELEPQELQNHLIDTIRVGTDWDNPPRGGDVVLATEHSCIYVYSVCMTNVHIHVLVHMRVVMIGV